MAAILNAVATMRNAGVKILAHPVFAPAEKPPGVRADDLHFSVFGLYIKGDAHFLGAAGGKGGILARPLRRNLAAKQCKAFLNVFNSLKAPHINKSAALHLFPHKHEVIAVHAFNEVLGGVDYQDIIHFFTQIVYKGAHKFRGCRGLARYAADNAAVKHHRAALLPGLAHAFYVFGGFGSDAHGENYPTRLRDVQGMGQAPGTGR